MDLGKATIYMYLAHSSEIDSNVELKKKIAVMSYGVIGIKV